MVAVGWDTLTVTFPGIRRGARVRMPEPHDLTRDTCEDWFDAPDVETWIERVAANRPALVTGSDIG
nr:hypothetical protein [Kocuria indica]